VATRNSRRGGKSDPDFFCCVTTRRVDSAVKLVQPVPASATDVGPDACGADELPWRLSLFAFELRAVGDATAALRLSHGRSCSLRGRPIGSAKAVRALLLRPLTFASLARRRFYLRLPAIAKVFRPPRSHNASAASLLPVPSRNYNATEKTGKETQKETQVLKTLRRKQSQEGDAGRKQILRLGAGVQRAQNAGEEDAVPTNEVIGKDVSPYFFAHELRRLASQILHLHG